MSDLSAAQSGILDELKADPVGKGEKGIIGKKPDGLRVEITPEGEIIDLPGPAGGGGSAMAEEVPKVVDESEKREARDDVGVGSAITVPARLGFEEQQVIAIKNTVAADCSPAELVMFLEVAARYGLDPFAGQIYAAKIQGKVAIIVSRDGLLAHAHRQDTFKQMDGEVVRANDEFKVVFKDGEREIEHSYDTMAKAKEGDEGHPRGPIIGAWARVVREGHGATWFFAEWSEYVQDRPGPWKKTPSAMILKCAETYALRKAFSISGVVGEDEVEKERRTLTQVDGQQVEAIDLGPRSHYIRELAVVANDLQPGAYRDAKLMALGSDPDGLVDELCVFITNNGGEIPEESIEGEVVGEEEAVEATA